MTSPSLRVKLFLGLNFCDNSEILDVSHSKKKIH